MGLVFVVKTKQQQKLLEVGQIVMGLPFVTGVMKCSVGHWNWLLDNGRGEPLE